jgi:hypothetical protein
MAAVTGQLAVNYYAAVVASRQAITGMKWRTRSALPSAVISCQAGCHLHEKPIIMAV